MRATRAACLYQETRLNLDPALPASTIDVLLPINGVSAFASRSSPKRRRIDRSSLVYDEATFSSNHLASESSIHFRPLSQDSKRSTAPRSILWRVLEERKVLELQAVDLTQDLTDKHEPLLTLRMAFPHAICPSGVVFAERMESGKDDGFVAFILTVSGEVVTLDLHKELFVNVEMLEDARTAMTDWCKIYSPSALSYRTPYRLLAKSDSELWASLNDGSLLRLEKEDNGSRWRESFFTEGGWKSSMRNLIPWRAQSTVRYEDVELAPNTAISIVTTPDGKHIWAACLDHTLRAWNVETGKIAFITDLAGDASRDLQKPGPALLDPARANLIRIVPMSTSEGYIVVTFSPVTREFKFWQVGFAETVEFGIEDIRPDAKLIPPVEELIDSAMWTLESFDVRQPQYKKEQDWELWILVRFGTKCLSFRVSFNMQDHNEGLLKAWQNNWACVDPSYNTAEQLRQNLTFPGDGPSTASNISAVSATEQWLDFLLYPGRFTVATLETALSVYWKSLSRPLQLKKQNLTGPTRPLKERICDTLTLSVGLTRTADDSIAYDRFEHDVESQWQIFYGVVKDLHKRRELLLSSAYDADHDLLWLVMTDQISAIRTSSKLETLWLNRDILPDADMGDSSCSMSQGLIDANIRDLGQVLNAVAMFRDVFPSHCLQSLDSHLRIASNTELAQSSPGLVSSIYDQAGIAGRVSDEDYNKLTFALEGIGGLANIDDNIFATVVDLLGEAQRGHHQRKQLTRYGARALIRGAQETLEMSRTILFDLLLLIIFMGGELEQGDLSSDFDADAIFHMLLGKYKEFNLLQWLASTVRQENPAFVQNAEVGESNGAMTIAQNETRSEQQAITSATILESIFVGDWAGMLFPSGSQSSLLTYWCRAWTFGARVSEQYQLITSHIMATLLKNGDISLAYEFMNFLPESSWTTYLRARLFLATSEFVEAASCFERAAHGLATGRYFDIDQYDSAKLVDLVERNLFNEGLAAFYQHVATLFEKAGSMSYVAQFASLGLKSMEHLDGETTPMRTDLLSRLFTASLQTSRYLDACSALTQYTDFALQKKELGNLLKSLLSASQIPLLLSLPLPCPEEVDDYLSALALKTSNQPFPSLLDPISDGIQYHKVLYAYRLRRGNLRAAASCLWDRLQFLRTLREITGGLGANETTDQEIMESYLTMINVLSLMDPEQAWILTRPLRKSTLAAVAMPKLKLGKEHHNLGAKDGKEGKRQVVILADVRKAWQDELDHRADVRAGRFSLLQVNGIANGPGSYGNASGGQGTEYDVFA